MRDRAAKMPPRHTRPPEVLASPPWGTGSLERKVAAFLQARKLPPGPRTEAFPLPLTHTAMCGGRYVVSASDHDELMDAWGAALEGGAKLPSLVERRTRPVGPVVVDIDLRQEAGERQYTRGDVDELVAALYLELGRLAVIGETSSCMFLLEKPAPRNAKGCSEAPVFKDGLHMMVPLVVTRPEVQVGGKPPRTPIRDVSWGAGCWVLGAGCWVLGAGCWVKH